MRANLPLLDDRDRAILRLLQQDGRLSNLELAQRINTGILTQMPGVVRVQSSLALRTVKKTTALPL